MRYRAFFVLAAPAVLSLAACGDAGGPEASAEGDPVTAGASAAATPAEGAISATDPDTPVSNTPTPAGEATRAATPAATRRLVDSNPPGDDCGASRVATFVAQEATPAVRTQVAAKVGHNRIRWVGPDTAVTMDFSPERLNVTLDRNDIITGGRCG